MPTISANIKWATNLDELRRELKSGADQLVVLQKAAERTERNLGGEGLMRAAHNAAAAIQNLGGVTKLTAAEQEKIHSLLGRAIDKYNALGQAAPSALKSIYDATTRLEPPTSRLTGFFNDLGKQVLATGAGFLTAQAVIGGVRTAIHGLTEFITSSIEAYSKQEAAVIKMTTALRTQGQATPAVIGQYKAMAAQFQNTTVFADDLVNEMQALLVQVGNVMPSQMQGALQAATDLASGLGIDLRTATLLVGKAFEGETGTLKRYGIVIDETKLKTQGVTAVLDAIQEKFGGQAQAEIDTYAGKLKQLANAWDDVKEAIGRSIINDPILISGLHQITEGVKSSASAADGATPNFIELWASFAGVNETTRNIIKLSEALVGLYQTSVRAPKAPVFAVPTAPNQFGQNLPNVKDILDEWAEADRKAKQAAEQHAAAIRALMDAFSGNRVIRDARNTLEALVQVEKSGLPISKLTRDQQDAINKTMADAIAVYRAHGQAVPPEIRKIYLATMDLAKAIPVVSGLGAEFERLGVQAKMAAVPFIPLDTSVKNFVNTFEKYSTVLKVDIPASAHQSSQALSELAASLTQLAQIGGSAFGSIVQGAASIVSALDAADKAEKRFSGSVGIASALFAGKASTSTEKWASGIAAGSVIAQGAMSAWSASAKDGSKAAGALHGAMAGAKAGAMFGPWGLAIGAAAGALIGFVHTLSSGRRAVKEFANSFDTAAVGTGFDELRQKLLLLGAEGDRLWIKLTQQTKKGDKAAAAAVIAEITKAFEDAKKKDAEFNTTLQTTLTRIRDLGGNISPALRSYLVTLREAGRLTQGNIDLLAELTGEGETDWHKIEAAVQRYGGSIEKLGGSFQSARMHDSWQQVIDDMDLFERGGINANDVLELTKGKITELVQQSQLFGTEIPENMRPWIQKLIESHGLLDANGKEITDINSLKFGETLQTTLQALNKTLQDLVDTLRGDVPDAAKAAGDAIDRNLKNKHFTVGVEYDYTNAPPKDFSITDGSHFIAHPEDAPVAVPAATGGLISSGKLIAFGRGAAVPAPHFETGGIGGRIIQFSPRGSDRYPAMLSDGEGVLNVRAMKWLGQANLHALNTGQMPSDGSTSLNSTASKTVIFQRGAFEGLVVDSPERVRQFAKEIAKEIHRGGDVLDVWKGLPLGKGA